MSQSDLVHAAKRITVWRNDPVLFVRDNFGVEPDLWQAQALAALARPEIRRIALKASAGPGKTAVLCWAGLWFMTCFAEKGEHPKGYALSCTWDNLRDNLWSEFSKWRQRSAFLQHCFELNKDRLFARDHQQTWFLAARGFSKTAGSEEQGRTLSGLHSRFVLYLIDESGDINPSVLRTAEQGLTRCAWGKILQAGNPTSLEGSLHNACTLLRDQWEIISISGDPDDPQRSPRVDIDWAREQVNTYGRDNPWIKAYILGQFPPSSLNTLIGAYEVESAMSRGIKIGTYEWSQKRIGIDVARFGDDRTILFPRQGLYAQYPHEMRNARSNDIAARIARLRKEWGSEVEFIDDTGGYGSGVVDACLQAGMNPMGINFSAKPSEPKYFNKRSEMWFQLAEWLRRGGVLPNIPSLVRELSAPTYTFQQGKFRLEEKEQIKKRLGFSPDLGDALALTFAFPDEPGQEATREGFAFSPFEAKAQQLQTDYDPFEDRE
jgi:hypothetical protein